MSQTHEHVEDEMQLIEPIKKNELPESLASLRALIAEDLLAVNELIIRELSSDVSMIRTVCRHIINSGGKRLRPLILLLTTKALAYKGKEEQYELAAIIEFIHTATLLHDDVVDNSQLRRGKETASALWGNQTSVLTGDFLYSRAFQILARRTNIPVMKLLADTTNQIAEGEVLQLMNQKVSSITEKDYREIIIRKTAKLYAAASEIAAMISSSNLNFHEAMRNYGLHLGMAFQMVDDLLDYMASSEELGKNIGDDLMEGKITLPLIYAMHHGNQKQSRLIQEAIEKGQVDQMDQIIQTLHDTNAGQYTLHCAKQEAQKARAFLLSIPDSCYKQALERLCDFVVNRKF